MLHLYPEQQRIITVLCENKEEYKKELFADYPCLNPNEESPAMLQAKEGVFPVIQFVELSKADSDWLAPGFVLYKYLYPGWRTNLYMCVDGGMKSTALMSLVEGQMRSRSQEKMGCQLNMTCYVNYPQAENDDFFTPWTKFGRINILCMVTNIREATNHNLAKDVLDVWGKRDNWLVEPGWSRESNRQAADYIYVKLDLAGLTFETPKEVLRDVFGETNTTGEALVLLHEGSRLHSFAEVEHRRWCAERLLGGWLPLQTEEDKVAWRTDNQRKEVLKKQFFYHGDLIPFHDLPMAEKRKDYEIIASISTMKGLGADDYDE